MRLCAILSLVPRHMRAVFLVELLGAIWPLEFVALT